MSSGLYLILLLFLAVAFIIYGTAKLKLHAFLVLLVTAIGLGLTAGLPLADVISAVTDGFGSTVGYIGIIIAAGSIIGTMLEKSGGALVMAESIIKWIGKARTIFAMSLTGSIISIPVYCDSGFIILSPLNKSLAKKANRSVATYAVALSMGLYATHVFVPPTPGPIAAAAELDASIGLVMLLGIAVTIPVLFTTYFYAKYIGDKIHIDPDRETVTEPESQQNFEKQNSSHQKPTVFKAFLPIAVPLILIALNSLTELFGGSTGSSKVVSMIQFLGDPNIALLLGVFFAFLTIEQKGATVYRDWVGTALEQAGAIILITGAGGALGTIMQQTDIGSYLGSNLSQLNLDTLSIFLPFILAAALKTTLGSSTVAIITSASLLNPLLGDLGLATALGTVLVTLAIGAGAMTVSHANDSYFWVVCQFSNMKVSEAYKLQTISSGIAGVTGIIMVFVLSLFLI